MRTECDVFWLDVVVNHVEMVHDSKAFLQIDRHFLELIFADFVLFAELHKELDFVLIDDEIKAPVAADFGADFDCLHDFRKKSTL